VENVSDYFQSFLDICPTSELPPRLKDLVKGYYAPIHHYQKKKTIVELQIWTSKYKKIMQYDRGGCEIIVEHSLCATSSGGPYLDNRGRVTAFHTTTYLGEVTSGLPERILQAPSPPQ
jgi:hypothetical protein